MSEFSEKLPLLIQALEDIQAEDIVAMDVRAQTTITDYMIVCSGRASRHVKAIADTIMQKMREAGVPALSQSGAETGDWVLVDFGDCVVHIMQPDSRDYYRLEELWDSKTNAIKHVS